MSLSRKETFNTKARATKDPTSLCLTLVLWNLVAERLRQLRLRNILNTNRLVIKRDSKAREIRFRLLNLARLLSRFLIIITCQLKASTTLKENGPRSNGLVISASVTRVWKRKWCKHNTLQTFRQTSPPKQWPKLRTSPLVNLRFTPRKTCRSSTNQNRQPIQSWTDLPDLASKYTKHSFEQSAYLTNKRNKGKIATWLLTGKYQQWDRMQSSKSYQLVFMQRDKRMYRRDDTLERNISF